MRPAIASMLLGALLFSSFPVAARADDAASLLAKHKAFVGWQFLDGTFHYLRESGDISKLTNGTAEVTDTVTIVRGNAAFRQTQHQVITGFDSDLGYTGSIFWVTDQNGFIRPLIGDAAKAQVAQQLVFEEATTNFDGVVMGSATVNGAAVSIVRISPPNSDAVDLYVDAASGAYKRFVIDPDGAYRTTVDILSYINGPAGKKFIGAFKRENSAITTTIKTVEAPANVAIEAFSPPQPTAAWTFDASNPSVPVIYSWYRAKRVYLHATINGVDGTFILDTGAGAGIVLTQQFADRLHLKQLNTATAFGVGGVVATKTAKVDTIALGSNVLSNVVVSYQPLKLDADGLMGFDLLGGVVAHLDLDAQKLTLYDPATTDVSKLTNGLEVTVDLQNGAPTIPMNIDDRIPVNAMLDTGSPTYVLFGQDIIDKDHLSMMKFTTLLAGVGGNEYMECGRIGAISAGPLHYTNPQGCVSKSFTGRHALVGLDFLRHFNMWFDYPHSQIILEPRKSSP